MARYGARLGRREMARDGARWIRRDMARDVAEACHIVKDINASVFYMMWLVAPLIASLYDSHIYQANTMRLCGNIERCDFDSTQYGARCICMLLQT